MDSTRAKFKTVNEYLSTLPENTRYIVERLRKAIKQAASQSEELISYNMPAFKFNGMLVWYAAYKGHIGFYPTSSAIEVFKDELADYKTSKGAIQFPIEKAIPTTLIKNIVKYRVKENIQRVKAKEKKKK
ncbi:MAG TPA: DUF1801 domain-containing protein [Chitinophagaceae bacterium]|jgi:uncharacterized protein YdhG (YjbR/CyaY superfamily)|nr:DUF1801 domain-containing protein [Chitinophagaceae bacterium]